MSTDNELDAALQRLGIPADAEPIATPEALLGRARGGLPRARTRWHSVAGGLGLLAAGLLLGIVVGRATAPGPELGQARSTGAGAAPVASRQTTPPSGAPTSGAPTPGAPTVVARGPPASTANRLTAATTLGPASAPPAWPEASASEVPTPRQEERPPEPLATAPEAVLAALPAAPEPAEAPEADPADEFASIPEDAPASEERKLPARELLGLEDGLAVGNGAREIEVAAPQDGARAALRVHAGAVRAPYSDPGEPGATTGLGVGYRFELEGPWTATLSADAVAMGWEEPTRLGLAFGAQGAAGVLLGRGFVRPGLAVRAAVTTPLPKTQPTTPPAPPALQLGPALLAEFGPARSTHLRLELGVEGQTPLARREEPWGFGPNASLAVVIPL